MSSKKRVAPLWLMGLSNSVFGMFGGIILVAMPEILAARHVPESTIAGMTAVMISPGFWGFLLSPMLDVRFSRRWYAATTAILSAVCLLVALLNLDKLVLVEWVLCAGSLLTGLSGSALGGWLSTITTTKEESRLSVWFTIGNLGGSGAMAVLASPLLNHLPTLSAGLVLTGLLLMPVAVYPFMPAPGPDLSVGGRELRGSFSEDVVGCCDAGES